MELLSFMYSGKLTSVQPTLLLDILIAADKFEVISCIRHCAQLLTSLPMTTESAMRYLDHPCLISLASEVQHLTDAAREFLVDKYKDMAKHRDELIDMPLSAIEAIFSSNDIHVKTEDGIYSFLLEWAGKQHADSEERHRIWCSRLLPLVRFSHMSWKKLHQVLACSGDDIDHEQTTKRITNMLLHKAYPAHPQVALAAEATACWQVSQRAYRSKPVKVVEFDRPCPHVIVYLDLTREECSRLFPKGEIFSHLFHLAGQNFCLMANCEMDEQTMSYSFGLWLGVRDEPEGSTCLTIDFEFAARTGPSGKFMSKLEKKVAFTGVCMNMYDLLFEVPWSTFIAGDGLFIDGVLHIRADFTVVEQQPESQNV